MLQYIAYVSGLVVATTFIHAACTGLALGWIRSMAHGHWALRNSFTRASVIATLVLAMSVAAGLESTLWAGAYWGLGELPDFRQALYFSLVTFTTLGYGDVTLSEQWRLLGAFEAANGIMMFGWTTALIAAASQRLYFRRPLHDAGS